MKENKPFQFVVTASAISYLPLPGYALYSGTKHAIQGFFEAARHELPKHQVITLIHPIAIIRVSPFNITFPTAHISKIN
ncbi:MAG TPA: SDR family NAD(P)-dependent oxidoreductase [Epulopiscium sp.]|nr:SDR family NAD(P)-dependent oxidoreductase [Candidatus Epulonipiscium sp.]